MHWPHTHSPHITYMRDCNCNAFAIDWPTIHTGPAFQGTCPRNKNSLSAESFASSVVLPMLENSFWGKQHRELRAIKCTMNHKTSRPTMQFSVANFVCVCAFLCFSKSPWNEVGSVWQQWPVSQIVVRLAGPERAFGLIRNVHLSFCQKSLVHIERNDDGFWGNKRILHVCQKTFVIWNGLKPQRPNLLLQQSSLHQFTVEIIQIESQSLSLSPSEPHTSIHPSSMVSETIFDYIFCRPHRHSKATKRKSYI